MELDLWHCFVLEDGIVSADKMDLDLWHYFGRVNPIL